jgi:hypothetical protein
MRSTSRTLGLGLTVADASGLFDASFTRPTLIECGCNMHGRRYFVKALDGGDKRAALPLASAAYQKLHEIEAAIRDRDPDDSVRSRDRTGIGSLTPIVSSWQGCDPRGVRQLAN